MQEKSKTSASHVLSKLAESRWEDTVIGDALTRKSYTYREFFSASLNARDEMRKLFSAKDETVCLVLPNSFETLVLYMGALLSGVRIALIDPSKGVDDIKLILSQVVYTTVIADEPSASYGRGYVPAVRIKENLLKGDRAKEEVLDALKSIDEARPFLVTFTSGSTGTPKGVMHSFGNLRQSAQAFGDRFNFGREHTFYHHLPMTYMAGVLNSFFLPLICGSKIVIGPRFSVAEVAHFWDIPIREGVNVFWFVPTMLALLLKLDRSDAGRAFGRSHKIIGCVGTAPLNTRLHKDFEDAYGIPLFESYGLSETLFVSTQYPGGEGSVGSVGKVLSGTAVTEKGDHELMITADWMFQGYLQNKKEELFTDKAFPSGDLGSVENDGHLHIIGRKKDIIIRGGLNLSPRYLEEFLSERNMFEESVIIGLPDPIIGERVVCFYVPHERGFGDADRATLLEEIRARLGKEYSIDEFVALETIPKNTNGKVDKLTLRALGEKK